MASTDSIEDNTGFAEKNGATFPILADPTKAVSEAYGVLTSRGFAARWTFYIDPDGKVAKIDRNVNPANAGADLVANLQALGAPAAGTAEADSSQTEVPPAPALIQ